MIFHFILFRISYIHMFSTFISKIYNILEFYFDFNQGLFHYLPYFFRAADYSFPSLDFLVNFLVWRVFSIFVSEYFQFPSLKSFLNICTWTFSISRSEETTRSDGRHSTNDVHNVQFWPACKFQTIKNFYNYRAKQKYPRASPVPLVIIVTQ